MNPATITIGAMLLWILVGCIAGGLGTWFALWIGEKMREDVGFGLDDHLPSEVAATRKLAGGAEAASSSGHGNANIDIAHRNGGI